MPLFMLKKKYFEMYENGRKTVELRAVKPQWKNCKPGDVARAHLCLVNNKAFVLE